MSTTTDPVADRVRAAAFRRLLRSNAPATARQLADDLEYTEPAIRTAIDALAKQGRVHVDPDGSVTGSAGLSIHPDRHEIDLDGPTFWTWCAYDILGIFAALGATGRARTASPDGTTYELSFRDGVPEPSTLVLFLPDQDCCTGSMYDQWCPNSNLFPSREAATTWATEHGLTGEVLTLTEAAERGGARWQPLTVAQPT